MKIKTIILAALLLCVSSAAVAGDDAGLWADFSFGKKFSKTFGADLDLGFRSERNLQHMARWDAGLGFFYRPVKPLKIAVGYTFIRDRRFGEAQAHYNKSGVMNGYNVEHDAWRNKHRAYLDLSGSLPLGRFTISLRERYQYTRMMAVDVTEDKYRGVMSPGYDGPHYGGFPLSETDVDRKSAKDKHYLRSRLSLEYNIRHCPVTPFVFGELSNDLAGGFSLDKKRVSAGIDWKVAKKHKFTIAYLWQTGADDEEEDGIHVLNLGYKLNF